MAKNCLDNDETILVPFQSAIEFRFLTTPFSDPIKQGLIARIMPLFDGSKNGRVKTKIL